MDPRKKREVYFEQHMKWIEKPQNKMLITHNGTTHRVPSQQYEREAEIIHFGTPSHPRTWAQVAAGPATQYPRTPFEVIDKEQLAYNRSHPIPPVHPEDPRFDTHAPPKLPEVNQEAPARGWFSIWSS